MAVWSADEYTDAPTMTNGLLHEEGKIYMCHDSVARCVVEAGVLTTHAN